MEGNIFNIQRFCIYDGPGIRTTVFLKGCNLRCLWCHNPESQRMQKELMFYKHKCVGCGKCIKICEKTFSEDCIACGECVKVCAHGAREVVGKMESVEEVCKVILKDKEYYKTSGGGVTLSGGEPLLQIDFVEVLLKECKKHNLHTAIETAANVPWKYFERILPYLDLVMFDLKSMDEENHIRCTGISNKHILDNARKLMQTDKKILFRMPVVPGYNDWEVEAVSAFVKGYDLELLAYHKTGIGKYDALNMDYLIGDVIPPEKEYMQDLAEKNHVLYFPTGI